MVPTSAKFAKNYSQACIDHICQWRVPVLIHATLINHHSGMRGRITRTRSPGPSPQGPKRTFASLKIIQSTIQGNFRTASYVI